MRPTLKYLHYSDVKTAYVPLNNDVHVSYFKKSIEVENMNAQKKNNAEWASQSNKVDSVTGLVRSLSSQILRL